MRKKQMILIAAIAAMVLVMAGCKSEKLPVALENRIEQPAEETQPVGTVQVCPNIYDGTGDVFHIMNGWTDSDMGVHQVEQRDDGIFVSTYKSEENMWYSLHTSLQGDFSQFRYLVIQVTAAEGTDYFVTAEKGDNKVFEYIFFGTGYKQQIAIDLTQVAKSFYGEMDMLQIFALPGKVGPAEYTLHDVWLSKEVPERFSGDSTLISNWKDNWSSSYQVEETENGQLITYNAPAMWSNISAVIPYPDPEYCQLNMSVEVQGSQSVQASIKINCTDALGSPISDDAIFSVETFKPGKNTLHLDMSKIFTNPDLIPVSLQIFLDSTNEQCVYKKNTLLITETNLSQLTDEATAPKQSQPSGGGNPSGNMVVCGDFTTSADSGYRMSLKDGAVTITLKNVGEWANILYKKPVTAQHNLLSFTMDNVDDSITQMQILLVGKKTEALVAVLTEDMLTQHGGPHTYTFYLKDVLETLGSDLGNGGTLKFQIESAPAAKDQYDGNGKLIISDVNLSYVSPFVNEGLGDWYVEWYREEDISVVNQGMYLDIESANRATAAANWSFIAADPTGNSGAGSTFSFELEYCSGQTGDLLVQIYGENDSRADLFIAMEDGKATYTLTVPETVQGKITQVRIYPENPENAQSIPAQSGIVRLYSAKLTEKPETLESLQPVLTAGDQAVILKAMIQDDNEFYYKISDQTDVDNKPALNDTELTGWTLFSTDVSIAAENGVTVYVQVIRVKDGKIKAWGEASILSVGKQFSNVGLQDWYVEWYAEDYVTLTTAGEYMLATTPSRKAAAQNWAFIAAKPARTAGAGSVFSFELEFSPERTSGDFLVQIYSGDNKYEVYLPIKQSRDTYAVTVPDSLQGAITEVRIFTDNPFNTSNLPEQEAYLRLYSAELTAATMELFENIGFGSWYLPAWASGIQLKDQGAYLAMTYNRSNVGWQGIEAEVVEKNITAGSLFVFTLDFGTDRGYADNFVIQFVDENGKEYDSYKVFPNALTGKAEYTVTVPDALTGTVTKVRILPENGWTSGLPSKEVTVKLYKAQIIANESLAED